MAINVKHFIELFNYRFNIPSYQRGYRWEEKQITDLLCDLVEFRNSSGESKSFYCLQPVVVTRNKELTGKRHIMVLPTKRFVKNVENGKIITSFDTL